MKWDLFMCHASEDKEAFVDSLVIALERAGFRTWYDRSELLLGSSLDCGVNHGLARSRYGIVVLSRAFFAGNWPQRELDGLVARELEGERVILPIWHGVTSRDVARHYPLLAGRLAVDSQLGIATVVSEIARAVRALDRFHQLRLVRHPTAGGDGQCCRSGTASPGSSPGPDAAPQPRGVSRRRLRA